MTRTNRWMIRCCMATAGCMLLTPQLPAQTQQPPNAAINAPAVQVIQIQQIQQAPVQQAMPQQALPQSRAMNMAPQAAQTPVDIEKQKDENAKLAKENAERRAKKDKDAPLIQVAILLDTSGSMSGLIDQARAHLWEVVNEFSTAERKGKPARLEVALYEYGKSSLPSGEGYVQMLVPFTDDLDKLSEVLFALHTNGGSEYCGWVINQSVEELGWSDEKGTLKAIFIAGNEPFTQGPVDYKDACKRAAEANITVSTIHCGGYEEGVATQWADGAKLADGSYVNIDHNDSVVDVPAPQDKRLAELSAKLNSTYIAYGKAEARTLNMQRQSVQDLNAARLAPNAAASRAMSKASGLYRNAGWDLIDGLEEETVDLDKIAKDELPEEMREMTVEEMKEHIAKKREEREKIKAEIKELSDARNTFLVEKRRELAEAAGTAEPAAAFGGAIMQSIAPQAAEQGIQFGN